MSPTTIIRCSCKVPSQDKLHGLGGRVHNYREKHKTWTCTGCGKDKAAKEAPKEVVAA